jgi:hypothetical protein
MAVVSSASYYTASAQQLTADQEKRIEIGINLIKLGCGTGSTHEKAEVRGTGDLSLSLKQLPGIKGGGNIEYSNEEAQGLASALQKEITAEGAKLSQSQLECMKPYIQKIFAVILPDQPYQPKAESLTPIESNEPKNEGHAQQEFILSGGQSIFLTKDKVVFSAIHNPYGGRGDLIGVNLEGKVKVLAVGSSVDFAYSQGSCSVTLLELPKLNSGKFYLRC